MAGRTTLDEGHSETYNTVTATYKAMQRAIAELLSKEHLTQPQFIALRVIAKKGAMRMRKISEEMLVTPPNMTGLADRLESKQLVKRSANAEDRRATMIELTAQGKRLQENVSKRYNEFMNEVLSEFTRSEQIMLRNLLVKLEQEIHKRNRTRRAPS